MGGRGTYSNGKQVELRYQTVGILGGVKILRPTDPQKAFKLPEESNSSTKYLLLDKKGLFHQYREYNAEHKVTLEIGYHQEKELGKKEILHIHVYGIPGVEFHYAPSTEKRKLTTAEFQKYEHLFKGLKIDRETYFN